MLVALVIIGVLSACIIPFCVGACSSTKVKSAAESVESILNNARMNSQAMNKKYEVEFLIADNDLNINTYTDIDSTPPTKVGKTHKFSFPSSIQLVTTFTDNKALFTPRGTSNGGRLVLFNSSKARGKEIVVLSSTARIELDTCQELPE